jgi:iron complex transport system permease protein
MAIIIQDGYFFCSDDFHPAPDILNPYFKNGSMMTKNRTLLWASLYVALPLLFACSLFLGSVPVPFGSILHILLGNSSGVEAWDNIILKSRLPQSLTAVLAGMGLGASGLQMQALFRNPLAGPSVLGLSSGASLGVALSVLAVHKTGFIIGNMGMLAGAVLGSGVILLLVLSASRYVKEGSLLLIVGLMTGYAASALQGLLEFFSSKEQLQAFVFWGFGSFGGVGGEQLPVLATVCGVCVAATFAMTRPMDMLLLGEEHAQSLGLDVRKTRWALILLTGALSGSITAYCGPIAFLGLATPHLCRMLFQASDHKTILPACLLAGGGLALLCDIVARMPGHDQSLPLNVVTSLLGAPAVLWIVLSQRNHRGGYL